MRRAVLLGLVLVACARHGQSREGAVPVKAEIALYPTADGEAFAFDLADAIARRQAGFDEHHADGTPNHEPKPTPIEIDTERVYSDHLPPFDDVIVRSARREALVDAVAAVGTEIPPMRRIVTERRDDAWLLRFVDTGAGFELEPGAVAKIGEPEPNAEPGVALFLTDVDAARFEELTRAYLGRRISMVVGDEALMTPLVQAVIPGGVVWISPGDGTVEDLLARLTR